MFHRLRFCQDGIIVVLEQPLSLARAFCLLHVNEKGLLGPSVPDGYTKLGLVGEFNFVGIFFPLCDGFLDLIYYGYVGNGRTLLLVPSLALLVFKAFGNGLACTHDV